jgi:hypothetical protein
VNCRGSGRAAPSNGRGRHARLDRMVNDDPSSAESERRVVSFHRGRAAARPPMAPPAPVEDLSKYQRTDGADDYRHRMIVNVVAFLFVIGLIGAGIWLADTMARMRKDQDCVLSGRRGCTPVEVSKDRW